MKLIKRNISIRIKENTTISAKDSNDITNSFFNIIKNNSSKKIVKIANFGTFSYKSTPDRFGRNPKTGTIYKIKSFKRFVFAASFRLKSFLN